MHEATDCDTGQATGMHAIAQAAYDPMVKL